MTMKKALLQKKLIGDKVKCLTCAHYCNLSKGQIGICNVRKNKEGKILTYNYEKLSTLNSDPIEKKPIFHFLPGSQTLSMAAPGCSFQCKNCQNWFLAHKKIVDIDEKNFPAKKIVKIAIKRNHPSISYTYSEPIVFLEYALETMKEAKKKGIKNIWVSNGFFTPISLKTILPYLDAINIDLKSFSSQFYKEICGGRLSPVLHAIKKLKKAGVWIELTTLFIPNKNDSEKEMKKIANFIASLGVETPWHIIRFSGMWSKEMKDVPDTPIETLEKAWHIGKKAGLENVYIGNVPNTDKQNTICPNCDSVLIERNFYQIKRYDQDGTCPRCHHKIKIIS